MSDQKPPISDQILDLLLDALQERQAERAAQIDAKDGSGEIVQPPSTSLEEPVPTPVEPTVTRSSIIEESLYPELDEPTIVVDDLQMRLDTVDEDWDEPAVIELPEEAAIEPQTGSIDLHRTLGKLAVATLLLVIIINIPFNRYGTNLARAMPDAASFVVRDGLLLKGSGPEVYVLENNQRRWITSIETFQTLGHRWERVHEVDDSFLRQFPEGLPLHHQLVRCANSPHVFVVEADSKRWIKDIPTFEALGYQWGDISVISCDALRNMPDGLPIPVDAGEPPQP